MPVLTKISPTKQGRLALFFDDEFKFSVDLETIAEFALQKDKSFTDDEYENLFHETQYKKAKEKAFKLLGYKSYTRYLLKQRLLREEFNEEVVEEVLCRTEELGFINDVDYARRCAADLLNFKKYSLSRIRQELRHRGVSDFDIDEALENLIEEVDPQEQITQLIQKKYLKYLSDEKGRRKTVNALLRLGYNYSQIRQAMNEFEIELDD